MPRRRETNWVTRRAGRVGRVRALNSESFCERVLSAGKLILPSKGTSLHDSMVEKLTLLRINKKFMRFMRQHHPEVIQEEHPGGAVRLPKQRKRTVGGQQKLCACTWMYTHAYTHAHRYARIHTCIRMTHMHTHTHTHTHMHTHALR